MSRHAAVILAAGQSSRLGAFKPLVELEGETLLARAARLFREAGVEEVLAVAGHRAPEVREEARRLGLAWVVNPDHARGMFGSVQAGVRGLGSGIAAFFVLPVDLPLVRPHTLRLLREARDGSPGDVLHPVFEGRRGHPPLIPAGLAPRILAHDGQGGLAGVLAGLPGRDVPVADRNIRFDIDTPEDLEEARRRARRQDIPTPGEALALLDLCKAGGRGHGHARGVADAALAMARALAARGADLDLELVESAALLHDIAKGQPGHERAGAELLRGLGFEPVARIVAAHRDIPPEDAPRLTERELVYLADKLVWGSTPVSVEERFQAKLDYYAHDPEACAGIRRRLAHALAMRGRVEKAAASPLEALLP